MSHLSELSGVAAGWFYLIVISALLTVATWDFLYRALDTNPQEEGSAKFSENLMNLEKIVPEGTRPGHPSPLDEPVVMLKKENKYPNYYRHETLTSDMYGICMQTLVLAS